MLRFTAYIMGTPAFVIGTAFVAFKIWNALIRAEVIPNDSLDWFTTAAAAWAFLCLSAGVLLYRAGRPTSRQTRDATKEAQK